MALTARTVKKEMPRRARHPAESSGSVCRDCSASALSEVRKILRGSDSASALADSPVLNQYFKFAAVGTGGQLILVVPEAEFVFIHRATPTTIAE